MEETLQRLKAQLEQEEWPNVYFYKFIVENHPDHLHAVRTIFEEEAIITINESKNGKYASISIKEVALHVDYILDKYRQASTIKGIISL
jgi:putative lipoic acid-binding regulatory protein